MRCLISVARSVWDHCVVYLYFVLHFFDEVRCCVKEELHGYRVIHVFVLRIELDVEFIRLLEQKTKHVWLLEDHRKVDNSDVTSSLLIVVVTYAVNCEIKQRLVLLIRLVVDVTPKDPENVVEVTG